MKILFLNPPFLPRYTRPSRSPCVAKGGTFYMPYYLSYCCGVLEKSGFDNVKLVDAVANEWTHEQTIEFVKSFNPNLVVIDTSTPSIYNDVEVATKIKETLPEAHINLVGTHPTRVTDETFSLSQAIDSICRGEFDYTVIDLARALEEGKSLHKIPGVSFRENGNIIHNEPRELIKNLDELPFVSEIYKKHFGMDGIKKYFYASLRHPQITILTARGCPFNCAFCNIPFKASYRARTLENVVEEFEYIQNELPKVKEIMLEDDTFPISKERTIKICGLLMEKKIKLTWSCNARVDMDFETLQAMKRANCRLMCVPPQTLIFTSDGFKEIKEVKAGDKVLTHTGAFHPVTKVFRRKHNGNAIKIKPFYFPPLILTPEHPLLFLKKTDIFCKKVSGICHPYHINHHCKNCVNKKYMEIFNLAKWVPAKDISEGFLFMPIPIKVINKESIKVSKNLSENHLQIVNLNQVEKLREDGLNLRKIASMLDLPITMIEKYFDSKYRIAMKRINDKNINWVKFHGDHSFIKDEIPVNNEFCLLAGYFAAEGSVLFSKKKGNYRVTFTFSDKEEKYAKEVYHLLVKLFGVKPKLFRSRNKREVSIFSKSLTYLFSSLFGKNSINRRIPSFFLFLPHEKQKAFLKGLLRGDGSPKTNRNGEIIRINLTLASKILHLQAVSLLIRLGILPSTFQIQGSKRTFYGINIEGYYELKKLGHIFKSSLYKGKFRQKRGILFNNFLIIPIQSAEEIKHSGIVMNLEVEKDESYLANMVAAHNCVGFESPVQAVLDNIHKKTTAETQLQFMKDCRKLKLLVNGCFILGMPGDTKGTIRETIEFAKKLNPDTAQFYSAYAYPGTEMWDWAKQNGYLASEDYSKLITEEGYHQGNINLPEIASKEADKLCRQALKEFYLRKKYLISKFKQLITNFEETKRTLMSGRTFFKHILLPESQAASP